MFVHYYTYLARPFGEVRRLVLDDPHSWMPELIQDAVHGSSIVKMIVKDEPIHITKKVFVDLGHIADRLSVITIPLFLEATGPTSLFPRLKCELEFGSLGDELTQITLHGRYKPPLGAVGEVIDKAVLHRVAEASVRHLVEGIAQKLTIGHEPDSLVASELLD